MEIGTNMRTAVDQCYINPWNSQKIEFSIVEPQYCQPNFIGETTTYNPELCIVEGIFSASTSLLSPTSIVQQKTHNSILVSEKLETIIRKLSLSKKGLCKILDVSRPSLYSWLNNSAEPEKENINMVNNLYWMIEKSGVDAPLFRGYVENPVNGYNESLLEILEKQSFMENPQEVSDLIKKISYLSNERQRKINDHKITEDGLADASKDLILEDNLNSL